MYNIGVYTVYPIKQAFQNVLPVVSIDFSEVISESNSPVLLNGSRVEN